MSTDRGFSSVEGLLALSLTALIAAMAFETRSLFRTADESQAAARNLAIARASTDPGVLHLECVEVERTHRAFKALKPLLDQAGLASVRTRYFTFVGTEANPSGRQQ